MLVPSSDEHIARLAEIEAMRGLTAQIGHLVEKVDGLGEKVGGMREDVAVLKARDEGFQEFKAISLSNRTRIEQLELVNAREDGQRTTLDWLARNWLGLLAIAGWVLTMLGVRPKL